MACPILNHTWALGHILPVGEALFHWSSFWPFFYLSSSLPSAEVSGTTFCVDGPRRTEWHWALCLHHCPSLSPTASLPGPNWGSFALSAFRGSVFLFGSWPQSLRDSCSFPATRGSSYGGDKNDGWLFLWINFSVPTEKTISRFFLCRDVSWLL